MNFANALMMTGRSLVTILVFLFIISVLYDFSTVDGYAALRSEGRKINASYHMYQGFRGNEFQIPEVGGQTSQKPEFRDIPNMLDSDVNDIK